MRPNLGIIGIGAFGEFMLKHLSAYFNIYAHDGHRDLRSVAKKYRVKVSNLHQSASQPIVILCVPVQRLEFTLLEIKDIVRQKAVIIDVCSVKVHPVALMTRLLPNDVEILSTHPLFGPQSGKNGIAGLKISLCNISMRRLRFNAIKNFLTHELGLLAIETTPEQHDREMAYVQGLTHLLSKIITSIDMPNLQQTTVTYDLLRQMVEVVRYDSDELFFAIEKENPFVSSVKAQFFEAAQKIEKRLK